MEILLNGKRRPISGSLDLAAFIARHRNSPAPVVAELNGEIIQNERWDRTVLKDGDALELISFVGGG